MLILNKDIVHVYNVMRKDVNNFKIGVIKINGGVYDGGVDVVVENVFDNTVRLCVDSDERVQTYEQYCAELKNIDASEHVYDKWYNVIFDVREANTYSRFCNYLSELFSSEQIAEAVSYIDSTIDPFGA